MNAVNPCLVAESPNKHEASIPPFAKAVKHSAETNPNNNKKTVVKNERNVVDDRSKVEEASGLIDSARRKEKSQDIIMLKEALSLVGEISQEDGRTEADIQSWIVNKIKSLSIEKYREEGVETEDCEEMADLKRRETLLKENYIKASYQNKNLEINISNLQSKINGIKQNKEALQNFIDKSTELLKRELKVQKKKKKLQLTQSQISKKEEEREKEKEKEENEEEKEENEEKKEKKKEKKEENEEEKEEKKEKKEENEEKEEKKEENEEEKKAKKKDKNGNLSRLCLPTAVTSSGSSSQSSSHLQVASSEWAGQVGGSSFQVQCSLPTTENIFNNMQTASQPLPNDPEDFSIFNSAIKHKELVIIEFKVRHGIPPGQLLTTFCSISLIFENKALVSRRQLDELFGSPVINKLQYGNLLAMIVVKNMNLSKNKKKLKRLFAFVKKGRTMKKKLKILLELEQELCEVWNKYDQSADGVMVVNFERESLKKLSALRDSFLDKAEVVCEACRGMKEALRELEVESTEEVEMMYAGIKSRVYRVTENSKMLGSLFRAVQTCKRTYLLASRIDDKRRNLIDRLRLLRRASSLDKLKPLQMS